MALAKGINSYATVSEADAYFEDRLDVAAWTSASDIDKAKALVTATALLDSKRWTGTAVSDSQTLAFPREGYYFDPRVGAEVYLDPTDVPTRILTALYELSYHLLNNDGILDDTGTVDNLNVGTISLNNIKNASLFPVTVNFTIKPLLLNAGIRNWWRAN